MIHVLGQGGALKGLFSAVILEQLRKDYGRFDSFAGTSANALHALDIASDRFDRLAPTWRAVRRRGQVLSVPLDGLRDGLISMAPGRRRMRRAGIGSGSRDAIPCTVGVVDVATGKLQQVPVDHRVSLEAAYDNTFTSATIPFAMEISRYWLDGVLRWGVDGGRLRTIPNLVDPRATPGDTVLVVMNSPMTEDGRAVGRSQSDVNTLMRQIEAMSQQDVDRTVLEHDIPYLRELAALGYRVLVWAPQTKAEVGPDWSISKDLNALRERSALACLRRGPVEIS